MELAIPLKTLAQILKNRIPVGYGVVPEEM